MISTKIKCLCGYVFPFNSHADDQSGPVEFFDPDNIKEICQNAIHDHRDEQHSGLPMVELEDSNEYDEQLTEGKATCPSCQTSYNVKFGLVLNEYADLYISNKLENALAPRVAPGHGYNPMRQAPQQLADNYVYDAHLTRQNGRQTLKCSNTGKIKYLD